MVLPILIGSFCCVSLGCGADLGPLGARTPGPSVPPSYEYEGALVEQRISIAGFPSASGIAKVGENRWLIIGDDARDLVVVDSQTAVVARVALGEWPTFEDPTRIPKTVKRDYEAVSTFEVNGVQQFIALGSGSKIDARTWIALGSWDQEQLVVKEYQGVYLYMQLMNEAKIVPESLNVEGAVVYQNQLRLLNRENNMALDIDLSRCLQAIQNQSSKVADSIIRKTVALPDFAGVRAGLSGACMHPRGDLMFFCASVEDRSGTMADGAILGSYVGWQPWAAAEGTAPTLFHLVDAKGQRTFDKLESVEFLSESADGIRLLGVTDSDDGNSEWLRILLPKVAVSQEIPSIVPDKE